MNAPRLNDEQIDSIMAKLMPVIADPDSPDFESMSAIIRLKLENSPSYEASRFVERLLTTYAEKNSLA